MQPGILFEGVTRSMADENITNCIKYMCNNFFNCFGFEVREADFLAFMSCRFSRRFS